MALYRATSPKCSDMVRVTRESHSFTCHPHTCLSSPAAKRHHTLA